MDRPTLTDISAARQRIAPSIHQTPVFTSSALAAMSGTAMFAAKAEIHQKTGSFKVRGALNAVGMLTPEARARGLVTVSAGNHAQAVAFAAREFGAKATVVMPLAASEAKAAASAGYGAEVIRHGTGAEAFALAESMAAEKGLTFVHPFDNLNVIAGAASVGAEIVEQVPDVDIVVVPIGGGGLISGVASAIAELKPAAKVYGVEPEGAAVLRLSLDKGSPQRWPNLQTIADGLAAPFAGEITFPIIRELVEDVVVVSDDEIAHAMRMLLMRMKLLVEPAGAAGVAALLSGRIAAAKGSGLLWC